MLFSSNALPGKGCDKGHGHGHGQICGKTGQMCDKTGHIAIKYFHQFYISFQSTQSNIVAYATAPQLTSDIIRYLDIGYHITNDLQNLTIHLEPYVGIYHTQNGTGLVINNVGSTQLTTLLSNFTLKNIFHIPSITKSFFSVS